MKKYLYITILSCLAAAPVLAHTVYYPVATTTVVYADREPPATLAETIPSSPGEGYVWVKGDWGWDNNDWHWKHGAWVLKPHATAYYAPGYWVHRHHHGWEYVSGYWQ